MGVFDHVGFEQRLNEDPDEIQGLVIDRLRSRNVSDDLADAIADAIENGQIIFKANKKGRPNKIDARLMEFMGDLVDWDGVNVDAAAAEAKEKFDVTRSTALAALAAYREYHWMVAQEFSEN